MIKRERDGKVYYLFPGGTVDIGESGMDAACREVKEEVGLDVIIGPPIAEIEFNGNHQSYFVAEIAGGDFGTGTGLEILGKAPVENGTYTPTWMPISGLGRLDVRPRAVVDLLISSRTNGWPAEILRLKEK